ncbi:MAG: hypothetical protein HYR74_13115 [Candidatus Eisenbacteria bacterium]|nr:hypothetical protein [Candidatus Eisenbacteria bacterium]
MRKPTHDDAQLLLHLYEIRREEELRRARAWFLTDFKPAGWAEIKSRYLSHSDEDRYFRMTISYWELVGTLVNRGVLHADLFFDHTGEDIVTWDRCKMWVADARADIRPTYLYQFEKMVNDHVAFRARINAAYVAAAARASSAAAGGARAKRAAKR